MLRTITALALLSALGACETVEGFGRDVGTAGETISETSDEVQEEL